MARIMSAHSRLLKPFRGALLGRVVLTAEEGCRSDCFLLVRRGMPTCPSDWLGYAAVLIETEDGGVEAMSSN
jgi:hypothetical protein